MKNDLTAAPRLCHVADSGFNPWRETSFLRSKQGEEEHGPLSFMVYESQGSKAHFIIINRNS